MDRIRNKLNNAKIGDRVYIGEIIDGRELLSLFAAFQFYSFNYYYEENGKYYLLSVDITDQEKWDIDKIGM